MYNNYLVLDSFWWDLSKNIFLPILIASGAAYMAYFIFVKETDRDKEKENGKQAQARHDKLLYFSALIKSVLHNSVQQKNNLQELIKKIEKDNIEFHLMTQIPLYDHKRIVETLDLENYLLSYTNYYIENREASVKEFKGIMSSIDFLYDQFMQIIDQRLKSQTFDHERKQNVQEIFERSHKALGILMVVFERRDDKYSKEFFEIFQTFNENHPGNNYDLTYYNNSFFSPFNKFCISFLSDEHVISQPILDLANGSRNGMQVYNQIKSENDTAKEDLTTQLQLIDQTISELEKYSKNLLTDFG